ncbi:MAG: hypothetical protein ACOC7O_01870 [Thermoplasmatota archaeon]
MGKEEALKKLDNLHSRIEFDIRSMGSKSGAGLKDYKKMIEEIRDEIESL